MRVKTPTLAWRAKVAWRVILATAGAYAVAALSCIGLSAALPRLGVPKVEAVVGATLLCVLILPIAPLFIFAARRTGHVTAGFAICATAAGLMFWLAQQGPR